jgi:hypothetical protein
MNLNMRAVCTRSREGPFRHSSIVNHEMVRTGPMRIRERRPDFGEASPNSVTANVLSAANIGTGRRFEHAIVRHE